MELALSLGDTPNLPFSFLDKPNKDPLPSFFSTQQGKTSEEKRGSSDPPIQLDLLPFTPVLRSPHPPIPWLTQPCGPVRELDVNRFPATTEDVDDGTSLSSPSSSVSPFAMDFSMRNNNAEYGGRNKRENEGEAERGSDDDENGSTRKKLRLSKDQSAFLEESFKEHTTLNPVNFLFLFV